MPRRLDLALRLAENASAQADAALAQHVSATHNLHDNFFTPARQTLVRQRDQFTDRVENPEVPPERRASVILAKWPPSVLLGLQAAGDVAIACCTDASVIAFALVGNSRFSPATRWVLGSVGVGLAVVPQGLQALGYPGPVGFKKIAQGVAEPHLSGYLPVASRAEDTRLSVDVANTEALISTAKASLKAARNDPNLLVERKHELEALKDELGDLKSQREALRGGFIPQYERKDLAKGAALRHEEFYHSVAAGFWGTGFFTSN